MTPVEGPSAIVAAVLVTLAFCGGCAVIVVALLQAREWADEIGARRAEAAAKDATKTRTYNEQWAGRSADVAKVQARITAGDYVVRGWWHKPATVSRLAEHRKRYGKKAA